MLIRQAVESDARAIASFIAMAEGEMVRFFTGTDDPEAAAEALSEFVLSPVPNRYSLEHNLVAELDGQAAGSIISFPADSQPGLDAVILEALHKRGVRLPRLFFEGRPGTYYLSTMGVNPDYRGKGIGAALMKAAENRGRGKGFSQASLLVDVAKPKVRALYERRGYAQAEGVVIGDTEYRRMVVEL